MRRLRDIVFGALVALCLMALVSTVNARQQVTQPGVVPGPTPVQVVGPTPLAVSGSIAAQQSGVWTVTAEQAGTWTVRLAEPSPVATPPFIRRGECYVLLTDIARGPSASPVYRVNEVQNGWIQIQAVRITPGTLPLAWINLSRLAVAAEAPCSAKP